MIIELDIEQPDALIDSLRACGTIEKRETPGVPVPAGGVSNRTVRVERANGAAWVLKQAPAIEAETGPWSA